MVVNKWRVLIVDDEPLARQGIKHSLSVRHPDFEVVGEAETMLQAWELIQRDSQIDGVFLDIHIETESERSGLDFGFALNNLADAPWVVFVTGYEKHSLEAVQKIRPVGYLLKPLEQIKVDEQLEWIRRNRPSKTSSDTTTPVRVEVKHRIRRKTPDGRTEQLSLTQFLLAHEILFVYSNTGAGAIEIHLVNGDVLKDVNITLKSWLDYALPDFIQTSKYAIVNLKYVSGYRIDPEKEGKHLLQFRNNPTELSIGATFFSAFRESVKKCC